MTPELTPEERDVVAGVEARLSENAPFPLTFAGLLERWERFVGEVEDGYRDSVDDYTNDLTARDALEEILAGVSEKTRETLQAEVQPIDRRFELATRPDDEAVLGRFFELPEGWWWRRLPRKLGGTLEATLSA